MLNKFKLQTNCKTIRDFYKDTTKFHCFQRHNLHTVQSSVLEEIEEST
jgi:hypothetical protein